MIATHESKIWDTYVANVVLTIQEHNMILNFQVMYMDRVDVVLGQEWLHNLGPTLKWSYKHNLLMFKDNGTHVLLLGENNVPPSLLICMAEIASTSHEIKEVFLYYSLCHVLSNVSFHDSDDDVNENVKLKHEFHAISTFATHVIHIATSNVIPNDYVL